ncbi:MAG: D-aminoacyl-tRNA deacylase [Xylanivirga thermophila]|uniref:D-aminoacyl-tRNA deacylase n=1 Tax=Xylanivirga thermophila TaxID=2496273 RepID=UPI00101BC1F4|nr:D-aminoacyl-tRNA deacylase [Xylanivirga thermophila]
MRAVVQRVCKASVKVDEELIGSINRGLLVFLGVENDDTEKDLKYLVDKIINLRIFEDEQGKMNLSIKEIEGEVLVVSQFTLYGDCRKGRRPSFTKAATPQMAKEYYEKFIERLKCEKLYVATGMFQACMKVEIVNDGPVTILLDSKKLF